MTGRDVTRTGRGQRREVDPVRVERVARAIHVADCDCGDWPCLDGWTFHRLAEAAVQALAADTGEAQQAVERVRAIVAEKERAASDLLGVSGMFRISANVPSDELRAALDPS